MRLDDRLIDFLTRPLMCIIAVADAARRPTAGRGVGLHVDEGREAIDVIFSGWQWPRLEPAIRQTHRAAVTFVSPSDYVSFQLKGQATLREIEARDHAAAHLFMAKATGELESLGVARGIIAPWLTGRDARVVRIAVDEIYIQTPGPSAGMRAGARTQ
ncbi:pyridoxamine 5'-phosphate oxidase family protein [Ensifer soli]|uniref:pyridoxamine 5'-phosphate oxidase family protein n=1 Tax=Ciceribacter sp. sgz301302 TaxID=3342379 RepID=UPI0035B73634